MSHRIAVITGLLLLLLLNGTLLSAVNASEQESAAYTLEVGGATIKISFSPEELAIDHQQIVTWIETVATAVARFYHGFPVDKLNIAINASTSNRNHGVVYRGIEPLLIYRLSRDADLDDLRRDWVLTHEMVHLAFPPVHKRHHWIEEGLATYIEPIIRVQAGINSEQDLWHWLLTGTPSGLPKTGDRGLDHTPTWGRTYWGGALFCLLADVEIRNRTANRYGLRDALRAITKAGGTMQQQELWQLDKALQVGDQHIGVPILMELYGQMKDQPVAVDLNALWQQLGVSLTDQQIHFNETAPQAHLRRALAQP